MPEVICWQQDYLPIRIKRCALHKLANKKHEYRFFDEDMVLGFRVTGLPDDIGWKLRLNHLPENHWNYGTTWVDIQTIRDRSMQPEININTISWFIDFSRNHYQYLVQRRTLALDRIDVSTILFSKERADPCLPILEIMYYDYNDLSLLHQKRNDFFIERRNGL